MWTSASPALAVSPGSVAGGGGADDLSLKPGQLAAGQALDSMYGNTIHFRRPSVI
jgi:hypothetical protein